MGNRQGQQEGKLRPGKRGEGRRLALQGGLTDQVPGLARAAADAAAGGTVGLVAHDGRAEPVGDLAEQQQQPRAASTVGAHRVQVDQQVGEPHGGAQVVQEVAHGVAQPRA